MTAPDLSMEVLSDIRAYTIMRGLGSVSLTAATEALPMVEEILRSREELRRAHADRAAAEQRITEALAILDDQTRPSWSIATPLREALLKGKS